MYRIVEFYKYNHYFSNPSNTYIKLSANKKELSIKLYQMYVYSSINIYIYHSVFLAHKLIRDNLDYVH